MVLWGPALPRFTRVTVLGAVVALIAGLPAGAQFSPAEYQLRRERLLAQLPETAVVVALGAHEPPQDYLAFYQAPSFNYLTGFLEPDAALIMVKSPHGTMSTLFVEPRVPAREVWVGARAGTQGRCRRCTDCLSDG